MREVDGYILCDDIKDKELRVLNRATIMANIIEDNLYEDSGKLTDQGKHLLFKYKDMIEDDYNEVYPLLSKLTKERGLR